MKSSALRKYLNNFQIFTIIGLIGITTLLSIIWLILKQIRHEDPSEIFFQFAMVAVISVAVFIAQTLFLKVIQDRPELADYLKTVSSELKVLGITLNDLHKDPDNIELIKKKILEKQIFPILSSPQKKFKFLLLNPSSPPFTLRSKDEGKDEYELRLECAKTIKHLENIIDFVKKNDKACKNCSVSFKFYESMPTHSLIITDTLVSIGPYLVKLPGTESKWINITNYFAIKQYIDEFEEIWEHRSVAKEKISNETINEDLFRLSEHLDQKIIKEYLSEHKKITETEYWQLVTMAKYFEASHMKMMID